MYQSDAYFENITSTFNRNCSNDGGNASYASYLTDGMNKKIVQ